MRYDSNTIMKKLREADGDDAAINAQSIEPSNDGGADEFEFDARDPYADASDKAIALSQLLDIDPTGIDEGDYGNYAYIVRDGEHEGEQYRVCTDEEVVELLREEMMNLLLDAGFGGVNLDLRDYVTDEYCEDVMDEAIDYDVSEMSDEDIIDWLLDNDAVSLKDEKWFKLKEGVDATDDDFDEYDPDNYDCVKRRYELEELCAERKKDGDLVEMFWDYGYGDGLAEDLDYYTRHHNDQFPYWFDIDGALDDMVERDNAGNVLAYVDGIEHTQEVDDVTYYIYRVE